MCVVFHFDSSWLNRRLRNDFHLWTVLVVVVVLVVSGGRVICGTVPLAHCSLRRPQRSGGAEEGCVSSLQSNIITLLFGDWGR